MDLVHLTYYQRAVAVAFGKQIRKDTFNSRQLATHVKVGEGAAAQSCVRVCTSPVFDAAHWVRTLLRRRCRRCLAAGADAAWPPVLTLNTKAGVSVSSWPKRVLAATSPSVPSAKAWQRRGAVVRRPSACAVAPTRPCLRPLHRSASGLPRPLLPRPSQRCGPRMCSSHRLPPPAPGADRPVAACRR